MLLHYRAYRPNCAVLLYVAMKLFQVENNRVVRKSWDSEIACTTKMKYLFNEGAQFLGKSNAADYDWFLIVKKGHGKRELVPIDVEKTKTLMIGCFSSLADTVDLVGTKKGTRMVSRDKEKKMLNNDL